MIRQRRSAIAAGERFAGFEIAERLGDGGMGVIFKARDSRLDREVALRIIGVEAAGDSVTRARLNRESTALASVDHPNVVPIYEAGEYDGRLFIASRWVNGTDFGALVREQGPLDPRRAVRIVNQVASALHAAHALGIMHRNVKPSSVLVTETDHAYLTDFGVARRASDLTGLTMQEHLVGSFDYLAPEYLEGGPVDARVDIYGLGCVLYEALTGDVPYPEPTPAAKMYAHRSTDPPSVRARRPEVPMALDAVVRRAMSKDPTERHQTPGEFATEAAGAVQMSAPPWVTVPPALGALDGESQDAPEAVPLARAPSGQGEGPGQGAGTAEENGAAPGEWDEPAYYAAPRPNPGRRWALGLAVLLFIAAPVALVIALVAH
ncbi:MAG TPA: protein kinase [Solirubrobacteraceae bacterium]|nr:protein kinase [Solirubrobacteraceae bacterium]